MDGKVSCYLQWGSLCMGNFLGSKTVMVEKQCHRVGGWVGRCS